MDENMYNIYIKRFRKFRHLSQEELAYLINKVPSYISMLEQDNVIRTRSPKLSILRDIALALEICPNDILIFKCKSCERKEKCNRKQYLENGNEDFFENNIIYYI